MTSAFPAAFVKSDGVRRILVTLGALFLFRVGSTIPVPGVDVDALTHFAGGAGLALERLSVFALGVMPIFSVLLLMQGAMLTFPALGRWWSAPQNAGRRRVYVLAAALLMAAFQALGVANGLEGASGFVSEPGWGFRAGIVATFIAATALLAWLAEMVTLHGLGNGFWLLLIAPSLARLPVTAWGVVDLWGRGGVAGAALMGGVGCILFAIVLLVTTSLAYERTTRSLGSPIGGDTYAHVWPPILAEYLAGFLALATWLEAKPALVPAGGPVQLLIMAALIAIFTALGAPQRASATGRQKSEGGCTGRPDWMVASAQIIVCIGGDMLTRRLDAPFIIGGAWLVVAVAVAMNCLAGLERSSPAPRV